MPQNLRHANNVNRYDINDEEAKPSRIFNIYDSNDFVMSKQFSSMSCCILSYKGPSKLTSDEELLGIDTTNPHKRCRDYLTKSREKAYEILGLDSKTLSDDVSYKNIQKDAYLIELKAFR